VFDLFDGGPGVVGVILDGFVEQQPERVSCVLNQLKTETEEEIGSGLTLRVHTENPECPAAMFRL